MYRKFKLFKEQQQQLKMGCCSDYARNRKRVDLVCSSCGAHKNWENYGVNTGLNNNIESLDNDGKLGIFKSSSR